MSKNLEMRRRGFLSIVALTPLAGLTPGPLEACTICLFQGSTLVAGPFHREFKMNSIMTIRLGEGNHFTFDNMTMDAPSVPRVFRQDFEAVTLTPECTLDIGWEVRET